VRATPLAALLCVPAILCAPRRAAGDAFPDWATAPMAVAVPASMAKAPAVDLLREQTVRFDGSERVIAVSRRVVKILTTEGRREAFVRASYSTRRGKVRSFRAWIQTPTGGVRELDDGQAIDAALINDDLYNEARTRLLVASDQATPGSIFVSESVVETQTPFAQFREWFQDRSPVVRSRFRVEAPGEWSVRAAFFHQTPVPDPARDESGWTWELADLAALPEEPDGMDPEEVAPAIGVTLVRSSDVSRGGPRSFRTWEEVSAWLAEISNAPEAPTPAVKARANSLTADAGTDEAKVRAIAKYVQGVNYVAVQMGLDRGDGYRPHGAGDVLSKNYGDCKDKANLMRELLRAAGIEGYLVVLSARDPDGVREEWPSPWQFDHCIVGARMPSGPEACSIETGAFGRLALFDPTDPSTPWGALPEPERGALVLVVASRGGGMIRTAPDAPGRNRAERVIDAELLPNGDLRGTFRETSTGGAASGERYAHGRLSPSAYARALSERLGSNGGEVVVDSVRAADDGEDGFVVRASFRVSRFARPVGDFLMIRPAVAAPLSIGASWKVDRVSPLRLGLRHLGETVRLRLPERYAVDELPDSVALEAPFAAYRAAFAHEPGLVTFERSLELKSRTIAPSSYSQARSFFEGVRASESVQAIVKR
jgi:transglutaminase-like putative cysteine protease